MSSPRRPSSPAVPTARERARAAVLADITAEARRQLADVGAAALSLRSVARELGMVSSGVYRYVASRDELLTLLIVEAYDELGDAVEAAVASVGDRPSARQRFLAAARAIRRWAIDHPHDYALLYGSPVPGYAAPVDTVGPATRVVRPLLDPLDGAAPSTHGRAPAPEVVADAERVAADLGLLAAPDAVAAGLGAVATVFGLISLELFGHTRGVVTDHDAFFTDRTAALADDLGLDEVAA